MHRLARPIAGLAALIAFLVAGSVPAQERQVYRYTDADGRVVYSDRPPAGDAKNVQQKRLGANFVEGEELSVAARQASDRFPVTLYTFACGETCQNAEGLLNRRGVPFATVNVQEKAGADRLQQLTGELTAPVLQVGDKLVVKGFNEAKWQAMLDDAGYPKTPAPRRQPIKPLEPRPDATASSSQPPALAAPPPAAR